MGWERKPRPHSNPGSAAAVLTSALEVRLGRHFAVRLAEIRAVKVDDRFWPGHCRSAAQPQLPDSDWSYAAGDICARGDQSSRCSGDDPLFTLKGKSRYANQPAAGPLPASVSQVCFPHGCGAN